MRSAMAGFMEHVSEQKSTRLRTKGTQLSQVEVAIDDAKRRASSGEWEDAKGASFVGLYCMCHKMIYGITPAELDAPALFRACGRMAVKAQHELFADDPFELAEFMRWSWEREKRKHAYAKTQGFDRNRLSWKWQFSRALVTDYRIWASGNKR